MLSRRELVRAGMLGGLVVAAPGLLAGCSDEDDAKPRASLSDGADEGGGIRLVSSDVARSTADPASIGPGAASVQTLGGALYGRLVSADNLALSPFSAAVALGMTVNGAVGTTRDEMLEVLTASDTESLDDGLNALTAYVESLAGPVPDGDGAEIALDSANQVFGQRDYPWREEFLDALASSYGAGLREVDFSKDTDQARTAINGWTSEQTHDRIPEIVPKGALDGDTRMVLVNALYFKAPWLEPFEESLTQDLPFHLASGGTADVPMMQGEASVGEGDGWRTARRSYAGGTLAMTFVLPDEGRESDLDDLVAGGGLADLLVADAGSASLTVPKWELFVSAPLTDTLRELGMATAFDPDEADFSGMTDEEQLSLSAVLQQVFISVDEAGTEAAAATAVLVGATSAQVDPPEPLVLDRPFVFVIHDVEHGTPLFLGKVVDPR